MPAGCNCATTKPEGVFKSADFVAHPAGKSHPAGCFSDADDSASLRENESNSSSDKQADNGHLVCKELFSLILREQEKRESIISSSAKRMETSGTDRLRFSLLASQSVLEDRPRDPGWLPQRARDWLCRAKKRVSL